MRLLNQLNARLTKLESIVEDDEEDSDTFDDSLVGPIIDTEEDFNKIPVERQWEMAQTFSANRNNWPDWLKARYGIAA